jgi:hypothetical protein
MRSSQSQIVLFALQSFKLPRSCLFPLNNAYVGCNDLLSGLKFVVSKEAEAQKLKQFFPDHDYLFFAQNLDLLTKSCTGGLLFFNGQVLIPPEVTYIGLQICGICNFDSLYTYLVLLINIVWKEHFEPIF